MSAAQRVLDLMPNVPVARWLIATVLVARGALPEAEREIDAGLAAVTTTAPVTAFPAIALHWLKGLLQLARGADEEARTSFKRELANVNHAHIYGRETAANTRYAAGGCELIGGRPEAARDAFTHALALVPSHAMARAGLARLDQHDAPVPPDAPAGTLQEALARAVVLVGAGQSSRAAACVAAALRREPHGSAGWTIPIDPLLGVSRDCEAWADVLAILQSRAS